MTPLSAVGLAEPLMSPGQRFVPPKQLRPRELLSSSSSSGDAHSRSVGGGSGGHSVSGCSVSGCSVSGCSVSGCSEASERAEIAHLSWMSVDTWRRLDASIEGLVIDRDAEDAHIAMRQPMHQLMDQPMDQPIHQLKQPKHRSCAVALTSTAQALSSHNFRGTRSASSGRSVSSGASELAEILGSASDL